MRPRRDGDLFSRAAVPSPFALGRGKDNRLTPRPTPCRARNDSCYSPSRCSETSQRHGLVAEWLRRGLQILAPRFDSGRGLQITIPSARPLAPKVRIRGATMAQAISSDDSAARRRQMVDSQLRTCDVTDQAVLAAFADVPREKFVPAALASLAYADRDVPALGGAIPSADRPDGPGETDSGRARRIRRKGPRRRLRVRAIARPFWLRSAPMSSRLNRTRGAAAAAKALLGGRKIDRNRDRRIDCAAFATRPSSLIVVNGAFERNPEELLGAIDRRRPAGRRRCDVSFA